MPLAVLVSAVSFLVSPLAGPAAGADTTVACEEAFAGGSTSQLVFTHDPEIRLAYSRQTVRLTGAWDPAAWESLSAALACVRVDDSIDAVLTANQAAPANSGLFEHSFVIPDSAPGTRLCTRIRIDGDPAGAETAATWVSKQHCYEIDHHAEQNPPPPPVDETPPPTAPPTTTTTAPPTTTTTTAPVPGSSSGTPGDDLTPAEPAPPFDSAGDVPPPGAGVDSPAPAPPTTPEYIPLLPATGAGQRSLALFRYGQLAFFTGLALLVLVGRPRRRRQTA